MTTTSASVLERTGRVFTATSALAEVRRVEADMGGFKGDVCPLPLIAGGHAAPFFRSFVPGTRPGGPPV